MPKTVTSSIFVHDDLPPEDIAMLQALYSRSPASVREHLAKLQAQGSGNFMARYYVGYGHASIGDCGVTTLFLEQVSMLAAKAFQDSPLYNGQEASTRYLDFAQQAILDPIDTPASRALVAQWQALYQRVLGSVRDALIVRDPFDAARFKTEVIWRNALSARAFDVARSLLPLGTTTLLSWSTTLRHARDHLRRLKTHPLPEVTALSDHAFAELRARYPHSFHADDMTCDPTKARTAWALDQASTTHAPTADVLMTRFGISPDEQASLTHGQIVVRRDALDLTHLHHNESDLLKTRPAGAALPRYLGGYGVWNLLFLLDFGSFRDIQRHRNGVGSIPFVDGRFGFHPWYLEQMRTYHMPEQADALVHDIQNTYSELTQYIAELPEASRPLAQYLFPMGTQVLCHVAWTLPQMVYVAELRSNKTVHPTLRTVAHQMLDILAHDLPQMALYGDRTSDDVAAQRGAQTIVDVT